MVSGGPNVRFFDAVGAALWAVALGLLIGDVVHGEGMGALVAFGAFAALVAAVISAAGVARTGKEEILAEMHKAFDLGYQAGQESVREIGRRH